MVQSDDVVVEALEAVARQQRRVAERDVERPAREDEDVDEGRDDRGRDDEDRDPLLDAVPRARASRDGITGSTQRASPPK